MKIELLDVNDILDINQTICSSVKQESVCLDKAKIESALGAAFYPGDYPFQYGGVPRVAGALCFFLIKAHAFMDGNKRTAVLASTIFLDLNSYELVYPQNNEEKHTALTKVVEQAAASLVTKDGLIEWFDRHKHSLT